MAPATLDATRHEWEEGHRRLEASAGDRRRYVQLLAELELVLDELAAVYPEADRWALAALAERDLEPGWPARLTMVQDAAFHVYSRGAVDYRP